MKSNQLITTIQQLYGDRGRLWLENLPKLLELLQEKWLFSIDNEFPNLSYHYVLKVTLANGKAAVLKCGVPNQELTTEIAALKHFAGHGAVNLLQADDQLGAILLEAIVPGTTLTELNNEEQVVTIFSKVSKQLHKPIKETSLFPDVSQWFTGFERLYNKPQWPKVFPHKLVDQAYHVGKELLNSMGERVLLHGDLHQQNILSAGSCWLAIDPKGVIGEREYEVGALMRNPKPQLLTVSDVKEILNRRLDLLVELTGFDRKRLWGWSFAQAVLAAIWCFEDNSKDLNYFLHCCELFAEIQNW